MIIKYEIPVDVSVEGTLARLSIKGSMEVDNNITTTTRELYDEGIKKIKENLPTGAQIVHLGFEDLTDDE